MKKTFTKILSVVLCAVMMLGTAPLGGLVGLDLPGFFDFKAEAATYSGECGTNLTWSLDTSTGVLNITGTGAMTNWTSFIFTPWRSYSSYIKSVKIANGIINIGYWAFGECYNLTSVTIPNSITTIGTGAFYKCNSLSSVTIPDNVTTIGSSAFRYCDSITNITVTPNNKYYFSDSYGALFNKNKTTLIQYPASSTSQSYIIPDGVTTIDNYAFNNCDKLTSITIPDSVTTIGDGAFYYCTKLSNVKIGNRVTTIAARAFYLCDKLTSVTIPDSVTTIGDEAFYLCRDLTNVTIGNSVTTIGESAFESCYSLTSVTIPDSVTTIGDEAFCSCESLTSVTIGNSVTTIGSWAFGNCYSLASITIPDSVTSIGDHAFYHCDNLVSVIIGNSVTTIGEFAFGWCNSLTTVIIGDSVTTIGDHAFDNCGNLTSVTIGDSVTAIGNGAFDNCGSLTNVYYTGTEEQWKKISTDSYSEVLSKATIHFIKPEHVHTPQMVTIPASCTVDGKEYTVCGGCGETIGEVSVIPASHAPGEWQTELEPTVGKEGKRIKKCTVCGDILETEIIPKIVISKVVDDESGIELEYVRDDYTGDVAIAVVETFDGAAFNLINTETNSTQTFIYDITMTVDGENVQPKGKVTVRIPLPENYDPARTFVYHVNTATGKVEPMSAKYEDGFMVFETTHFSYYAVVEQLDVKLAIKQPSVTTINYGETLVLQLEDVEVPEGYGIEWSIIGDAVTISVSEDGKECRVTSTASGNVSVIATLVDENGEPVPDNLGNNIESFINILSKAGFWQKLISFFKNLFRMNRIIY